MKHLHLEIHRAEDGRWSISVAIRRAAARPHVLRLPGGQGSGLLKEVSFLYSKANSLANQGFFFLFFSEALGTQPCYLQSLICTVASFCLLPSHSLQFSHTLIS